MQRFIIIAIVIVAVGYLVKRAMKKAKATKGGDDCGSGCNCDH